MLKDLRVREFTAKEARLLNPLQLALVGDGVYELFIRNHILSQNLELTAHKIHIKATIMHVIENDLTEEESYIYKRGRNAKSATIPKNADVRDYRMATGFEALVGYLYLTGNFEKLEFIFIKAISIEL